MAKRTGKRSAAPAKPEGSPRERGVAALMALLGERDYARIGLADIAAEAGLGLADLRAAFDGKLAMLAAFTRSIDEAVLAGGEADAGESPRDRLFDLMMRRIDALGPYKPAIRNLARSARRDPGLAFALHRIVAGSQKWTLAAANIHHGGLRGRLAVEGLALVHAETVRAWLADDGPDHAKTMAALDRALTRGEQAMRVIDDARGVLCRIGARAAEFRSRARGASA